MGHIDGINGRGGPQGRFEGSFVLIRLVIILVHTTAMSSATKWTSSGADGAENCSITGNDKARNTRQPAYNRLPRKHKSRSPSSATGITDSLAEFAEQTFVPEEYAEAFFAAHPEAEAEERCAELTDLRCQTQELLRAEVASHYQLFMRSTEDIQHVEADIARLRRHVGRMQKSLKALDGAMTTTLSGAAADNVSIAFAASSKVRDGSIAIKEMEDGGQDGIGARARDVASLPESLRSWGATGATGKRGMAGEGRGGGSDGFKGGLHHQGSDPAANLSSDLEGKGPSGQPAPNSLERDDLPAWVAAAMEDLDKCIVENQRSVAVNHIVKLRALLASLSPSRASSPHSQDLQRRVTSKGKEIAGRIVRELDALAPGANLSILFDFADMAQQLRFLVALDEAETAVDFFVRNKGGVLARALHSPETSGEPLVYVAVLAERFFGLMADACESFDALFTVSVSEGRSEAITAGGTPITPPPNFEAFTSTDVENQRGGPMSTPWPSVRPPECFLRLVLWVEEEVRQFAVLLGRQLRSLRQDWLLYRLRVEGKARGKDGKLAKGIIAGSGGDGTGKVVEGLPPCKARQGPRPTLSPPCLPLSFLPVPLPCS